MDNSVGQTLEKIKLQEQNNEIKLREKRECKIFYDLILFLFFVG